MYASLKPEAPASEVKREKREVASNGNRYNKVTNANSAVKQHVARLALLKKGKPKASPKFLRVLKARIEAEQSVCMYNNCEPASAPKSDLAALAAHVQTKHKDENVAACMRLFSRLDQFGNLALADWPEKLEVGDPKTAPASRLSLKRST